MKHSPIIDFEIKSILKKALTDKVNDKDTYLKSIDQSYYYEGLLFFKSNEL